MWYKVEEKLPEENKPVLVRFAKGGYSVGFQFNGVWMFDTGYKFMRAKPISWCEFEEYKE